MTNNNHPITPPPELIEKWHSTSPLDRSVTVATQAARWGADEELEACLMEIRDGAGRVYIDETKLRVCLADDIWTARRPHPPSLKEQANAALGRFFSNSHTQASQMVRDFEIIRRAVESLPD